MRSLAESLVSIAASGSSILRRLGLPKRTKATAALTDADEQRLEIRVNGKYSPDTVVVRQGIPVKLNFIREEDDPCSEWVIFSRFGVRRRLAAFKTTAVVFTPIEDGEFPFTCQFGMYRGRLVVLKATGRKKNAGRPPGRNKERLGSTVGES